MLTLLSECHFWTFRDEIRIKDTDFGAFKYATKKDYDNKNHTSLGKKDYVEKRDGIIILKNRRSKRLKENLKKFEELLKIHKIIHSEWHDACSIRILLSNGLLVYLCINIYTGDLSKMAFDKYFIGKLASDVITDAVFTRQHILLAYNTNQITLVYLQKPNVRKIGPEKISNMDPKIFHILIPGSSERKLARHIIVNDSYDLIIIWTKSSQSEIYPWRPTIRDQDRANIHIFKLRTLKLEPITFCWTENDPIAVEFLRASDGCILTLEQKISRKGEITAEICSYETEQGKMKRSFITSIPIGTQICCYGFSPDQEKLILGTIDRSVCIHDLPRRQTKFTSRADIIPRHCAWHPDSGLIMIANDKSQFQCFDSALSFVANQLISEDVTPSNLLDLSHYFTIQPNLLNISFSCKPYINLFSSSSSSESAQTDCFLFLIFENGPVACLRFFAGTGISGDVHNSGLTHDVIIGKYLSLNQFEKAVNLLLSLNWESCGAICLISLHQIANYVFRKNDIKASRNELFNKALQSFTDDLSDETKDEFADQVIDLKRRFFFFLLRHHLFVEAFEIAKNVGDYDLFMDLYNVTRSNPTLTNLSQESYSQAELALNQSESTAIIGQNDDSNENSKLPGDTNSFSSCSQHSTCSECISTLSKSRNPQYINNKPCQKHQINQSTICTTTGTKTRNCIPPLPYFKSSFLDDENLKINIPKPELKHNTVDGNGNTDLRLNSAFKQPVSSSSNKQDSNNHLTSQKLPTSSRLFKNLKISHSDPISSSSDKNNGTFHLPNSISGPTQSWSQIPDQTIGIPIVVPSLKLLPRASTVSSQNYNHLLSYNQTTIKNRSIVNNHQSGNAYNLQPKYFQHPLVSGTIPSTKFVSNSHTIGNDVFKPIKKPAASILSNSGNNGSSNYASTNLLGINTGVHNKKDSGEKNKVKFSDTVQVAVVPEIPRKEKPLPPKRNGFRSLMTDPEKELADSLPLCHPNDEYLKDFNPISEPNTSTSNETDKNMPDGETSKTSTIKVVHFGVV